jgi:hypothetical protein
MADKSSGLDRREFLRRAAVTTAAAAWAAPVIQTVSASPAFAQTNGTPQPGCFHSITEGKPNGCMETCKAQDDICGPPDGVCAVICNAACGGDLPENSCPPDYCDPECWGCDTSVGGDPTKVVFIC